MLRDEVLRGVLRGVTLISGSTELASHVKWVKNVGVISLGLVCILSRPKSWRGSFQGLLRIWGLIFNIWLSHLKLPLKCVDLAFLKLNLSLVLGSVIWLFIFISERVLDPLLKDLSLSRKVFLLRIDRRQIRVEKVFICILKRIFYDIFLFFIKEILLSSVLIAFKKEDFYRVSSWHIMTSRVVLWRVSLGRHHTPSSLRQSIQLVEETSVSLVSAHH
jgi:hypothetical protein